MMSSMISAVSPVPSALTKVMAIYRIIRQSAYPLYWV